MRTEVHSRIGQTILAFTLLKWCCGKKVQCGLETLTLLRSDMNKLEVLQM